MNVTKEEAQETLNQIDSVIWQTRRAIAQGPASKLLVLWGIIWVIGYGCTQFFPDWNGKQWLPLDVAGIVISIFVGARRQPRTANRQSMKIAAFWFILFGYAVLWANLLHSAGPASGELTARQFGAFFATVPMFAYVVGGMWLGRFFVWLGAIVTALTVAGFVLLPHWFNLWMALTGGGSLIIAGFFIHKSWR